MKAEGAARRKRLLSLMPAEFTVAQLAHGAGITKDAASAQIQKMVKWREIVPTSSYQNPRTYRKAA